MLAIRMQRLGRKGHPTFRVVVQDSRRTPTSGKYVALLGSYDPHTKTSTLSKDQAEFYLSHGAQPSERVVRLFQSEGVKLPNWVKTENSKKTSSTKNPEKLRKNRPAEEVAEESPVEAVSEETPSETETEKESVQAEEATSEASAAEESAVEEPKADEEK